MFSTQQAASITKLRQHATSLIQKINDEHDPLFILQNSEISAVLLDPQTFSELVDAYQDQRDYELGAKAFLNKKEKIFSLKQIEAMRLLK